MSSKKRLISIMTIAGVLLAFLFLPAVLPAFLPVSSFAAEKGVCKGFGPQTPRDIDQHAGTNASLFSVAPPYQEMNLCNIHFHVNAEHKAQDFAIFAGEGHDGHGGGYKCAMGTSLSDSELLKPQHNYCEGTHPGDTIEVHWVYSSCDIQPGKGLGSCLSEQCGNPNLRVESQVFVLVNDPKAMNFNDLVYQGHMMNGRHQAKALPSDTGAPVVFLGSTTGPSYTEEKCSPYQVTWSVRPKCAKLDINSLSTWCQDNIFHEDHAHGVRQLVTHPELLSEIH